MMFCEDIELAREGVLARVPAAVQKQQRRAAAASRVEDAVAVNPGPIPFGDRGGRERRAPGEEAERERQPCA
jgi:hypothetical protein